MAFDLGDLTKAIALFGFGDLLLRLFQQSSLVTGNAQVVNRDRDRRLGGVTEAQILELVGHRGRDCGAVVLVGPADQIAQGLLVDHTVAKRRRLPAEAFGRQGLGFCGGLLSSFLAAFLAGFLGGGGGHGCRLMKGKKGYGLNVLPGLRWQPPRQ